MKREEFEHYRKAMNKKRKLRKDEVDVSATESESEEGSSDDEEDFKVKSKRSVVKKQVSAAAK